jgi:hypothetical protein
MVKAKEFFDLLCNKLNYRFFTGLPFEEAKQLFSNMSSDFMHYIPATRAGSALGMAYGTRIAGFKSCLILSTDEIVKLSFSLPIPLVVITNGSTKFNNLVFDGDLEELEKFLVRAEKYTKAVTINIGGDL